MSDESIKCPSDPHNFLNPWLNHLGTKTRVLFSGNCLKQNKIKYNHEKIVNIYIACEINKSDNTSSDPTLENCLFGAVILTKKMLILIIMNILDMELDLIGMDFFSS